MASPDPFISVTCASGGLANSGIQWQMPIGLPGARQ